MADRQWQTAFGGVITEEGTEEYQTVRGGVIGEDQAAVGGFTKSIPAGALTLAAGGVKQTMLMRHKIPAHGT